VSTQKHDLAPACVALAEATTKTKRLLLSFQSIELRFEHYNPGNQGPYLRDFGFAPSVASALIRWGEQHNLVCWFENERGVSSGTHCWEPAFLMDACDAHLERFGPADLTEEFVQWCRQTREREDNLRTTKQIADRG